MIYSKLYLEKKINYIPLFVAVGISIALSLFVYQSKTPLNKTFVSKDKPTRYEVVNLSSSQAGVFWESKSKEEGWIELRREDGSIMKIYDERDLPDNLSTYIHHYVSLKNLKENTDYYFQIGRRNGAYVANNGNMFHFKTPKKEVAQYDMKPAYGRIVNPNGKPAQDVFVLLKVEGKSMLFTQSKATGEWLIPLHTLVDVSNGKVTGRYSLDTRVDIEFIGQEQKSSYTVTTLGAVNPLASTIVLGKNYNLLAMGEVLSVSTDRTEAESGILTVVYPRENSIIPASRPLIKGQGVPGEEVFVFINSKPQFSYRTVVDKMGEWRVLPTSPIGAGGYVVAVTSKDEKGAKVTIRRNFNIAKSGEQVLGVATGEPTTAPTLTPRPTQPPVPTIPGSTPAPTLTPVPTLIVLNPSPTIVIATTPTNAPLYPTVVPTSGPPRTGLNLLPLFLMSVSFVIVGAGLMLVF